MSKVTTGNRDEMFARYIQEAGEYLAWLHESQDNGACPPLPPTQDGRSDWATRSDAPWTTKDERDWITRMSPR